MDESENEAAKFIEGEVFFFELSSPCTAGVDGDDYNYLGGNWKKKMIERFAMEEKPSKVADPESKTVSNTVSLPVPAPRTVFTPIPAPRSAPSLATEVVDCSTPAVLPSPTISLPVPAPRALSRAAAAAAAGTNPTPAVTSFTLQPPVTASVKPSLVPTPEATSFAGGAVQNVTFNSGGEGGSQRTQPVRRTHHEPMPRGCAVKFVFISRTFFLLADMFYPDDDNVNDPEDDPDVLATVLDSDDCHACPNPLDHVAGALPNLGMYQVRHLFHEIMPSLCWPDFIAPIADCRSSPGTI